MSNEDRNEPIFKIEVTGMKKRYSDPKLFIPKINGRATVKPNKRWCVYFYWRSSPNGKLDKKITLYKDLNRFKTVSERKTAGKALVEGYRLALSRGWNPVEKKTTVQRDTVTIGKAIDFALSIKKGNLKEATIDDYVLRSGIFKKWLKENYLIGLPANEVTVNHIYDFLDYLQIDYRQKNGKKLSNNSIDNTKRVVSTLFTEMKNKRIIPHNFVKDIPKFKSKAVKNKPFTKSEIERIKVVLLKKDPYLIHFLAFMIYPVLRPREIVRLKIGDINTKDWLIGVETKTKAFAYSRIIKKMRPVIKQMNIDNKPKGYSLFSPSEKPAVWETKKISSKVNYFSKRFSKIIREMEFDSDYTLYSVRHTAIWNLYNNLNANGLNEREIIQKLMPITGHTSEQGLRNYLREITTVLPPDHSDIYSFDF